MDDEIILDYPKMETMIQALRDGRGKLDETRQEMQRIAKSMNEDVFKGLAGDAFVAALNDKLSPTLDRLRDKFEEIANDLQRVINDFKSKDKSAATDISN